MSQILILEDDNDLRNLYVKALSFRGYDVVAVEYAEKALNLLKTNASEPELAILDMSMEGLSGAAVVEYIRHTDAWKDLPIIVVSCDEEYREKLREENVVFLPKPISIQDLYTQVSKLMN